MKYLGFPLILVLLGIAFITRSNLPRLLSSSRLASSTTTITSDLQNLTYTNCADIYGINDMEERLACQQGVTMTWETLAHAAQ